MPGGQEIWAALLIFLDPFFREAAVADFGENLTHLLASLGRNNSRARGVVALLGGIADRIAHVAEATAINEIDDQLQLVHAFKVGHFGLIARLNQGVKASFDQFADTAAKNGLLTKKIGLGFFGERRFQNAGARAAEAFRVGKRECFGFARGVLL